MRISDWSSDVCSSDLPDQLASTARGLEDHSDLTVVIEHTGWPRNDADEERALWKTGIDALASLGDNVVCKLSGLAMPLGSLAVEVMAPWLEYAKVVRR